MKLANAPFNNSLRREIDAPHKVADVLEYQPSLPRFEEYLEEALVQRLEVIAAELHVLP